MKNYREEISFHREEMKNHRGETVFHRWKMKNHREEIIFHRWEMKNSREEMVSSRWEMVFPWSYVLTGRKKICQYGVKFMVGLKSVTLARPISWAKS